MLINTKRYYILLFVISGLLLAIAIVTLIIYMSGERQIDMSEHVIKKIRKQAVTVSEVSGADPETEDTDDPLNRKVDFDFLKEINSDCVFWLYIPGTPIDYPVMLDTESYYLNHDITGQAGSWGSLFTYPELAESDAPIVYGHHVTGYEPAFGKLEKYLDSDFAFSHPEAYVYLPDGTVSTYQFYCALDTDTGDLLYRDYYYRKNYERWGSLLSHLSSDASVINEQITEEPGKLLILSTCKEYNTLNRIAVVFRLR